MCLMNNIEDTQTTARIDQVQQIVKQHLDCLLDSGTEPTEIKAVAQNFIRAIEAALGEAIVGLLEQVKEKEDEEKDEEKTGSPRTKTDV